MRIAQMSKRARENKVIILYVSYMRIHFIYFIYTLCSMYTLIARCQQYADRLTTDLIGTSQQIVIDCTNVTFYLPSVI